MDNDISGSCQTRFCWLDIVDFVLGRCGVKMMGVALHILPACGKSLQKANPLQLMGKFSFDEEVKANN